MHGVKHFVWGALFGVAILGLIATPVFAQPQPGMQPGQQPGMGMGAQKAPGQAKASLSNLYLAEQLMSLQVRNRQGEDLGKIQDFAIQSGQDKIAYAAISQGAAAGIGGKLVGVPLDKIEITTGQKNGQMERTAILNVEKKAFDNAKELGETWPAQADISWMGAQASARGTEADRGAAQPGMGQPGMGQPGMGQPGMGQPGMGQPAAGQKQVMKLSEIMDWKVARGSAAMGRGGQPGAGDQPTAAAGGQQEEIGQVRDALVDVKQCSLAFGILSFNPDKVQGMREKQLVAVPWNKLHADQTAKAVHVMTDPSQLARFAFSEDRMPKMDDPNYTSGIRAMISQSATLDSATFGYIGDDEGAMQPGQQPGKQPGQQPGQQPSKQPGKQPGQPQEQPMKKDQNW